MTISNNHIAAIVAAWSAAFVSWIAAAIAMVAARKKREEQR